MVHKIIRVYTTLDLMKYISHNWPKKKLKWSSSPSLVIEAIKEQLLPPEASAKIRRLRLETKGRRTDALM
jgi:hypothetical protein